MKNVAHASTIVPLRANANKHVGRRVLIDNDQTRLLTIEIDASRMKTLLQDNDYVGSILQKELRLWRKALGPRAINTVELNYQNHHLEPFEITGLIHTLASTFQLDDAIYRIVIQPEDADKEVLALLKGLKFSHCQFVIEHAQADALGMLKKPIANARTFQFDKVGVQIYHSEGMENLSKSIKSLRAEFEPDYIFIGAITHILTNNDLDEQQTLFEDDLSHRKCDFLSLGPETRSQFGDQKVDSFSDIKRYIEAIQNELLPIN